MANDDWLWRDGCSLYLRKYLDSAGTREYVMDTDMAQVVKEFGLDVEDTDTQTELEKIKRSLAQCDKVIARMKRERSEHANN